MDTHRCSRVLSQSWTSGKCLEVCFVINKAKFLCVFRILSCAHHTTQLVGDAFTEYRFADLTELLYDFWLYKFCNTYLESIKPVIGAAELNPAAANAARQTLYTVADIGLRLLHPLMPFLTEELYQRLPRRAPATDPPSISVTPFPEVSQFAFTRDEPLEEEVVFLERILHEIRGLRSEYNLAKTQVKLYLRFDAASGLLEKMGPYLPTIKVCFVFILV